jgi:hypothetical protein
VTLSSFSAGYGAIRSILQHPDHFARIGSDWYAIQFPSSESFEADIGMIDNVR